tara:strand:- start:261 stop:638 length:378 start_codon:yes stop_codon:yes gene_type:complete
MMSLTDKQKERQVAKIYDLVFTQLEADDDESIEDGLMKVEINPKIREIFLKNLPFGEEIDIVKLEQSMKNIVADMVVFLREENPTLNEEYTHNVVAFIVADLVNTNLVYESVDSAATLGFDPMFG